MTLRYGSVCSGIEAASVAWHPLGWRPQFFSEIEAAPRAILKHHYPTVPLHGDFTTIREGEYGAIDLLVGGTPCQSFSVAGLRGGLADGRGNLALEYLRLAQRLRPRWLVWENVPGVLSSNGGRDFGAILGGMVELGYGFAYRVLDAQYVRVDGYGRAVPQRRRRVFVVGYLGDWRRAGAVLFERACLRGDPAPRRDAGAGVASSAPAGSGGGCSSAGWAQAGRAAAQAFGGGQNCNPTDVSTALTGHPGGRYDLQNETFIAEPTCGTLGGTSPGGGWRLGADEAAAGQIVAQTLRARDGAKGVDSDCTDTLIAFQQGGSNVGTTGPVTNTLTKGNGNESGGVPCIAFDTTQITSAANRSSPQPGDPCHPLAAGAHPSAIAFSCKDYGADATSDGVTPTLRAMGFDQSHANAGGQLAVALGHNGGPPLMGWAVRRLTPTECERLQGLPDGYTAVPWRGGILSDGPRYKALGNSFAVNVVRWIGRRIEMVEAIGGSDPRLLSAHDLDAA